MNEYYQKIRDPSHKGAVFMAVCRGKVSEGLDFANANGRAVLIIGLPFPPLKDPRVMLKQRYLEEIRTAKKEVYITYLFNFEKNNTIMLSNKNDE